jgi:large subunit ribosomal protein L9
MKVIMLQYVYKTGVAGEIVNVADGYARNFLIPRGMAKVATKGALKSHEKLMEQVETRRSALDNQLNAIARRINGVELIFERRASPTGTLYGSVTTQEIADALLAKTGDVDINRRRISQQSLRELGEFDVAVRLGNEISPMLHIVILREGETAEFLRKRAAAASAGQPAEVEAETEAVEVATEESAEATE